MNDLVINQETEIENINPNAAIFDSERLNQLSQFANMMAKGKCTVPKHLAGSVGDCLAITMQAAQWGMNPFAVAQKTHLVNGTLGYEAQLVNAVISSSSTIVGRFHYEYGGNWDAVTNANAGWSPADEAGLYVQVGAVLKGEKEITWLEPLHLQSVLIRNSPLWKSDPKQQIAYLGVKKWARLYAPAVIMGVYTPDEIEPKEPRDITPVATADELNSRLSGAAPIDSNIVDYSLADFEKDLQQATTPAQIKTVLDKVGMLNESDKPAASDAYKARIAELKAPAEQSPRLQEALEIINIAQGMNELNQALEIAQELRTPGEIDIFQAAFEKRELEFGGNAS